MATILGGTAPPNKILGGQVPPLPPLFLLPCIDDILVGKMEADHLRNLEAVLKHLQDHGVYLKKEKC